MAVPKREQPNVGVAVGTAMLGRGSLPARSMAAYPDSVSLGSSTLMEGQSIGSRADRKERIIGIAPQEDGSTDADTGKGTFLWIEEPRPL